MVEELEVRSSSREDLEAAIADLDEDRRTEIGEQFEL
jgi:hypothetical protein